MSNETTTQHYDSYLIDLDGTVYWGDIPIPHAAENINALNGTVVFTTNNASRSPEKVAQKLSNMGFEVKPQNVSTSAQLGVQLLQEKVVPPAEILVLGTQYLTELVTAAGYRAVTEDSSATKAVIQGHSVDTGWHQLSAAARAIRNGALYIATNKDLSLPSEKGLNVGNGAMVGAVELSTGTTALTWGKPSPIAFQHVVRTVGFTNPLVVGDRLDTDIQGGVAAGYDTWCVLTGVTSVVDICNATKLQRPTYVSKDLEHFASKVEPKKIKRIDQISADDISKKFHITSTKDGEVGVHFKTECSSVDDEICSFIAWAWQNEIRVSTVKGIDTNDQNRILKWRYRAEH